MTMTTLYHCTNWQELASANVGDTFTLRPGTQNAEGVGVYFSEGTPRPEASDGSVRHGLAAIIEIEASSPDGWWRSKGGKARKFGKARTWHSAGKRVCCTVRAVEERDGLSVLQCDWEV